MRPITLVLLAACGASEDGSEPAQPGTDPSTGEPAPYVVPELADDVPEVSLDAVQSAFQDALDQLLTIHAGPVEAAYDQVMDGQDERCPYYYTTPDGTYWYDSCESDGGSAFNGYVFAYSEQGAYDEAYGVTTDYWSAFGAATIIDADGRAMELGGSAYVATAYGEGYTTYTSLVQGTFRWDGATDSWLAGDVAPDLVLYGYTVDGIDDKLMYIDGGLSGLDGGWAVAFSDNQVAGAGLGVSCGIELQGTVGVRTPEGVWVDVVFDGERDGASPGGGVGGGACDGCGAAYIQGEKVGEVCVDPTVLVDWAVTPW